MKKDTLTGFFWFCGCHFAVMNGNLNYKLFAVMEMYDTYKNNENTTTILRKAGKNNGKVFKKRMYNF